MKIYFDNTTDINYPNCKSLSSTLCQSWWLVSSGTRLKRELAELGTKYFNVDNIDECGLYFVEVNGDPCWWSGCCEKHGGPRHILGELPSDIIAAIKTKKLRLIISADREGGSMFWCDNDVFLSTYNLMQSLELPIGSVLIMQGNRLIENQYSNWVRENKKTKLFAVKYVNHFSRIFPHDPESPVVIESIKNKSAADYNSLNRTYKDHRSAHLYHIAKLGILDNGLVSANEIRLNQLGPLSILAEQTELHDVDRVLAENYPRYIDGDWANTNAANLVNIDIFKNSLLSFITETKFNDDVVFLTEKLYKSLTYGHPMIILGPCGTLAALRELGYKTDWCGIDPSYNDIKDHRDRFYKTHAILVEWINLSRQEKIKKILNTMSTIEHNFHVSKNHNFYHQDLLEVISISKSYFND